MFIHFTCAHLMFFIIPSIESWWWALSSELKWIKLMLQTACPSYLTYIEISPNRGIMLSLQLITENTKNVLRYKYFSTVNSTAGLYGK